MMLLFDLGNSRCKWALLDPEPRPGDAFAYGDDFSAALDRALAGLARPTRALAASVAGEERNTQLHDWLSARWGVACETVSARPQQLGVTNTYDEPARLGADRWAALIGARGLVAGAVCVVDCGTAVTVDALDAAGVFRGGVILPGLALQRAALRRGTHAVDETEGRSDSCLARSTAAGVAAGTLHGLAGAIDRVLDEQARALGAVPQVLLTGGDAPQLAPLLRHSALPVPDLVLRGLARIAEQPA
jgi:type III pantothenate kinase